MSRLDRFYHTTDCTSGIDFTIGRCLPNSALGSNEEVMY